MSRTYMYGNLAAETNRMVNVPNNQSTNPPITEPGTRNLLEMLGVLDDRVQGNIRRRVYGERADGTYAHPAADAMATMFHSPRSAYAENPNGNYYLAGSRALQAGGVTAAGIGLANLTQQMMSTFGGPKDEPSDGTLYM
jgi:hypothetical protein